MTAPAAADPGKDLSGNIRTDQGAKVADIARQLKIDRSAALRRLWTTEAAGLVFNLEKNPRKGRPNYYRTTDATTDTTPISARAGRARGCLLCLYGGWNVMAHCTPWPIVQCFQQVELCKEGAREEPGVHNSSHWKHYRKGKGVQVCTAFRGIEGKGPW